jgi:ABC-type Mn2+/Zn2+ transport system ATPase subunit
VVAIYGLLFGVLALVFWNIFSSALYTPLATSLDLANMRPRDNPGPFLFALVISLLAALIGVYACHLITTVALTIMRRVINLRANGGLTMNAGAVNNNAQELVKVFDIRTPGIRVNGGNLSGGNQQKMVVAREFSRKPQLLIAAQPTRGIDVGSIEFIHNQIVNQRDAGAAVLVVSAELDEVMALSDRIAVMYKGTIIDIVPGNTATREQLGLLMAGIRKDQTQTAPV